MACDKMTWIAQMGDTTGLKKVDDNEFCCLKDQIYPVFSHFLVSATSRAPYFVSKFVPYLLASFSLQAYYS